MKLSDQAIAAINNARVRMLIGLALGVNEATIIRYISLNKPNGELTKAASLEVIKEETGLSEKKILVVEEVSTK